MSKKSTNMLLTEVELEMMTILWSINSGTVRDVLAELPNERKLAYTSASTIIRILEQKGFVGARKDGKTFTYYPILQKDEYEKMTLSHVVSTVFNNTPRELIKRLVLDGNLTDEEKKEIKKIIQEEL
jgi:predicted transcriptional regulator